MIFLRSIFLHLMRPFTWLIGKISKPLPGMKASFLWDIMNKMELGDVLLSESGYNLSNVFIKGRFKHAAIFCGDCIVEAIGEGVVKADFTEWIMQHDHVAILRPRNIGRTDCKMASIIAKAQLGKPYDFTFDSSDNTFYCSELIRYSYEKVLGVGIIGYYGVDVMPSEYYHNTSVFEIIAEC